MLFKRLLPIIALTFVNTIGYSLLIPVFPSIVASFGYGTIVYGLLLSTYSICQFFASPLLGTLSDKYGRKPVLIISHAGTLTSWFILGLAYFIPHEYTIAGISLSFIVILISRITDGITGGNISVSNAYVADVTQDKERSKAYGILGATFGIGFLIGPVMGALSSATSLWYLGTVMLAIAFSFIALIMLFFIKESNKHINKNKEIQLGSELKASLLFINKFKKYSDSKVIQKLFQIRFIQAFIFTGYISIFVIMLGQRYGLSVKEIGYVFTIFGVYSIVNQGFVIQKSVKLFGVRKALSIGMIVMSIGLVSISFASNLWVFVLLSYIINFGVGSSFITIKTLLNRYSSDTEQGEVMGIDESLVSLNSAYVPFVAGIFYAAISYYWFIVLGLVGFVCFYMVYRLKSYTTL